MATVLEAMEEQRKQDTKDRRALAKKSQTARAMIEEHVLPYMPRTLEACFRLERVSSAYGPGMTFAAIDVGDDKKTRKASGTIEKVAKGLKKGGWTITQEPSAEARTYAKDMTIQLSASRIEEEKYLSFYMNFNGFKGTQNCRLVEKEVIVAYVPEHTETRLVVECEEPA